MHPHTLAQISSDLGVDEGDLQVLAAQLTESGDDDVVIEIGIELRKILSPDGERTSLAYWDEASDPI